MADEGIPNTEIGSIRPSLSPGILPTTTTTGVVDVVDEKDESFPKTSSSEVEAPVPVPIIFNHPKGWRLHLLTVAVMLCLFSVNLEVSIVSTALIAIANDLDGFDQTGWVVTGYLLTYTALIIIWAKLSDIFGRKVTIIGTVVVFGAFSGACGAAQTMAQLIIFRVFQGTGAAGLYSMAMVIFFEMLPKSKYAVYGGLASAVMATAGLLGPLFGGLISDLTTWRWIFLLNVPVCAVIVILLVLTIPAHFPYQGQPESVIESKSKHRFSRASLSRVDFFGASLLLGASMLLVTALLEASSKYSWSSAVTISVLVISVFLWISFVVWEKYVSREGSRVEPVFPWRFVKNRGWLGMLLVSFLVGVPYNVVVIDVPQRFQAVDQSSPILAGLRLLPYVVITSLGSIMGTITCGRAKIYPIYLLAFGSSCQVIGLGLLSSLPDTGHTPPSQYGYECIAGVGVGMNFGLLMLMTPFVVETRDLAVATGATIQFRMLGGAIGLAIATSVMNGWLTSHLSSLLNTGTLNQILQNTEVISTLPAALQVTVRQVFSGGYNLQMRVVTGLAALQFPAIAMMWRKQQIKVW